MEVCVERYVACSELEKKGYVASGEVSTELAQISDGMVGSVARIAL
jgi:hypothetical protein